MDHGGLAPGPLNWLRDWASWIIFGIGSAWGTWWGITKAFGRSEREDERTKAMHEENRSRIAAMEGRLFSLEAQNQSTAVRLASVEAILTRVEATTNRIEARVDKAVDGHG